MHFAFVALHHRASNGVLRSSFEFWIGFRTLIRILDRLRDVMERHTQSNLRTSLRSYVYSVYYRTGRCRIKSEDLTPFLRNWSFGIKAVPQRPAVKDISRKSPCETYTYIHTWIHTYIHKWTSCMALNFKLWKTVELVIGPRSRCCFEEFPSISNLRSSLNGTSDVFRNSRITTRKI